MLLWFSKHDCGPGLRGSKVTQLKEHIVYLFSGAVPTNHVAVTASVIHILHNIYTLPQPQFCTYSILSNGLQDLTYIPSWHWGAWVEGKQKKTQLKTNKHSSCF